MGIFRNLMGTQEDSFQIGLKDAPLLQRVSTTARLQLSNLLRWLPGGSAVAGVLLSDASGDLSVLSGVQGNVPYHNGVNYTNLAPGTAGQVLTTQGAGANPTWTTNANGDVAGPASSIDLGMVTYDGTTGKLIKDSGKRNYGGSATDPTSPTPANGDLYYNDTLNMWMAYDAGRTKWLSLETFTFFAGDLGTTPTGAYYQGSGGRTLSDADGFTAPYNGTVVALGYTRTDSDAATFEVTAGGSTVASLASSATKGKSVALDGNFSADAVMAIRNASGGNITSNVQVWVRMRWRL